VGSQPCTRAPAKVRGAPSGRSEFEFKGAPHVEPCWNRAGQTRITAHVFEPDLDTSTKPARRVSDGWPVASEITSISSRSDGTSSRSTWLAHSEARPTTATVRRPAAPTGVAITLFPSGGRFWPFPLCQDD